MLHKIFIQNAVIAPPITTKPDQAGPLSIRIKAKVSKGTYIRTLGEDIGEALGCGAHLSSLRRIATPRDLNLREFGHETIM